MRSSFPEERVDDLDTVLDASVLPIQPERVDEDATHSFPEFEPLPLPAPKQRLFAGWLRGLFKGR